MWKMLRFWDDYIFDSWIIMRIIIDNIHNSGFLFSANDTGTVVD